MELLSVLKVALYILAVSMIGEKERIVCVYIFFFLSFVPFPFIYFFFDFGTGTAYKSRPCR